MLREWNQSGLHYNCIHEYLSLHCVYYCFLTRETTLFAPFILFLLLYTYG
jgi:hypothetical protein